jgi:hypothetical protein
MAVAMRNAAWQHRLRSRAGGILLERSCWRDLAGVMVVVMVMREKGAQESHFSSVGDGAGQ